MVLNENMTRADNSACNVTNSSSAGGCCTQRTRRRVGNLATNMSTAAAVFLISVLTAPAQGLAQAGEFTRRLQMDAAKGYRHLTIQQYAQEMPALGTKIAIPAHVADASTIVDNGRVYMINGIQPHAAARIKANIVLGTAPEEVQTRVLRCLRNALMHLPCAMMVLGTVEVCEGVRLGVKKAMSCIAVDSAWSLAEVGTYQQAIELKIELPRKN